MKTSVNNLPTVSYQKGKFNIAFVFSCPGRKEKECGRVCAGTTGTNLQILLEFLNENAPLVFPSSKKEDYRITNASDKVHYIELSGDTEASTEELFAQENVSRLKKELNDCSIVICMGEKALEAVLNAKIKGRIICGSHLSNRNINCHFRSGKGTPYARSKDRIQQIGRLVVDRITNE